MSVFEDYCAFSLKMVSHMRPFTKFFPPHVSPILHILSTVTRLYCLSLKLAKGSRAKRQQCLKVIKES